jgi:hypothetical protein
MIIPLHLIPAQHRGALDFSGINAAGSSFELPDLGLSIAGPVEASQLQDFQVLMQQAGLRLQPTRMLYDRLYALERLADAHASACPALREMAMRLFDRYQRAGEWIALMQ